MTPPGEEAAAAGSVVRSDNGADPQNNRATTTAKKYYWTRATEKLKKKSPGAYAQWLKIQEAGTSGTDSESIVDDMLERVKVLGQKVDNKRWKLPFKVRKDEVIIREALQHVFKALKMFK